MQQWILSLTFVLLFFGDVLFWIGGLNDWLFRWAFGGAMLCASICQFMTLLRWLPVQSGVACIGVMLGTSGIQVSLVQPAEISNLWIIPFVWISVVLSSRATARFCLDRFRGKPFYGAVSIALTVAMCSAVYPGVAHFLEADPPAGSAAATAAWLITISASVVFTAPWMIDKRGTHPPRDGQSVIVWLLLDLHAAGAAAARHDWFWMTADCVFAFGLIAIGAKAIFVRISNAAISLRITTRRLWRSAGRASRSSWLP